VPFLLGRHDAQRARTRSTRNGISVAAVTAAANGSSRGCPLDRRGSATCRGWNRGRECSRRSRGGRASPGCAGAARRRCWRTGRGRVRHEAVTHGHAGRLARVLPAWLHEREVALTGADTPRTLRRRGTRRVDAGSRRELVAMGLWLLDNCDLEVCATTAAELGQWDFHLALRRSASPVRPAARSTRSPHSDQRVTGVRCDEGSGPHLERGREAPQRAQLTGTQPGGLLATRACR
jgi:hypothetical protein